MSRFLSFDKSPCVTGRVRAMLVGAVRPLCHRGINRHFPVDQPGNICLGRQRAKDPVPGPVATVTAVAFPHRLPRPEMLRQIPPRDPSPIPVNDSLGHETVILERSTQLSPRLRHQRSNTLPLGIRQHCITRIHHSILPTQHPNHWETGPSASRQGSVGR